MSGSNTEDILAGRSGLKAISFVSVDVDEAGLNLSSIPQQALYALVVVEGFDLTASEKELCCRFATYPGSLEDINDNVGFPIGHLGQLELKGRDEIVNFSIKMISTVTSALPKIKVQYYA